jgi:hypothetical protein
MRSDAAAMIDTFSPDQLSFSLLAFNDNRTSRLSLAKTLKLRW